MHNLSATPNAPTLTTSKFHFPLQSVTTKTIRLRISIMNTMFKKNTVLLSSLCTLAFVFFLVIFSLGSASTAAAVSTTPQRAVEQQTKTTVVNLTTTDKNKKKSKKSRHNLNEKDGYKNSVRKKSQKKQVKRKKNRHNL